MLFLYINNGSDLIAQIQIMKYSLELDATVLLNSIAHQQKKIRNQIKQRKNIFYHETC